MNESAEISFGPVRPVRLFEGICDQIRDQLSAGTIQPGDKLPPEREMAEQFGVSRSAVREALRSLEVAGLIALRKGTKGGAFVLEAGEPLAQSFTSMLDLGRISLADFTEARSLITDVVVRLVCARATQADFDALDRDIDRLERESERLETMRHGDRLPERIRYITDFYDLLAASTGNQTLRFITLAIAQLLSRIIMDVRPRPIDTLPAIRRRIVKSLRARDAKTASKLLADHFDALHAHILTHQSEAEGEMRT